MIKIQKNSKGITLIALIITIIILLILAGISIASLTQSGLFARAQEVKQKTENAQLEEEKTLSEYEELITNYIGITNVDTNNTNPEAAMPEEATLIEGDATKGIVIKDSNGNEWTWVEVPKTIFEEKVDDETDYENIKDVLITYASDYRLSSYTDEWYEGCGVSDSITYIQMYNKMLNSVYKNGGFWISRYEIGDASATELNTTRTSGSGTSGIAVSQANMIPYNYLTCSQAQGLASEMSTDENKTSSLLFGIQWNLVCKFLETKGGLSISDIKSEAFKWGNYSGSIITLARGKYNTNPSVSTSKWLDAMQNMKIEKALLTTGASEYTNRMNICDFAGNVWEYTLDKKNNDNSPSVARGGCFVDEKSSARNYLYTRSTTIGYPTGFRSTLY